LEVGSFSYWFDKPWFQTEGRLVAVLIIPSSWVSQLGGYLHAISYLSKNLQNTSHFVTLFLAHGDVVVGFAIFHIVLFQKRKKRKKKRKKALLHGM
jgi:hypothetical protein